MLRLWSRRSEPETVYYPETQYLGPIDEREWKELLPELSKSYDTCKPLYRAMQIMLRRQERAMSREPERPVTEQSLLAWNEEQKKNCYQSDILRYLVRLPILAAKQMKQMGEREEARKKESERARKR